MRRGWRNSGLPHRRASTCYDWEKTHQNVGGKGIGVPKIISGNEAAFSYGATGHGAGIGTPDRRRLSVAVLNCHAVGLGGPTKATVATWLDVFLVQPAFQSGPDARRKYSPTRRTFTSRSSAQRNVGQGNGLVVRRDVPYLLR